MSQVRAGQALLVPDGGRTGEHLDLPGAPDGKGTKLSVHVEFKVPDNLAGSLPSPQVLEALKKSEGELVINNLKAILEH